MISDRVATPCPACAASSPRIGDRSRIGLPDIFECTEHGMIVAGKLTRKRKICLVCGHPECPSCVVWCDEVVVDEDGDSNLCCDGTCTYG